MNVNEYHTVLAKLELARDIVGDVQQMTYDTIDGVSNGYYVNQLAMTVSTTLHIAISLWLGDRKEIVKDG